jgi:hypothetical protein
MNFKLEINKQEIDSNIVFNNILFDFFKVNIVERHSKSKNSKLSVGFVNFKVRTLNDELIETKEGNGRVKLKNDALLTYNRLKEVLNSYEYKNRLINRKTAEQNFVDFILSQVISKYKIN